MLFWKSLAHRYFGFVAVMLRTKLNFYLVFFHRMGEIVVELYWKHAPQTCRNFAELARRGYYNGTKFHRIIPDFMIQGKAYSEPSYLIHCRVK